ncbi:MAG TPA: response regulator [Gemmatimonadales bacterium]
MLHLSAGARAAARLAGVPLPESNDATPFDDGRLESVLGTGYSSQLTSTKLTVDAPNAPRILIVEDHYDTALMLADLLGSWGFVARVARTGAEARQIAAELRPRVVLLDLSLPDLHGYRVAKELRENSDQPMSFVVVTGWAQPVDQSLSMAAGISHHLVKPVNPEALRRILEDYRKAT